MIRRFSFNLAFSLAFSTCPVIFQMMMAPEVSAKELKVLSDQTAGGFGKGLMVVVPDLVKGELRFVQLGK